MADAGCWGCVIGILLAPVIAIIIVVGQHQAVGKARAMLDGRVEPNLTDIGFCLGQLGAKQDAEAIDLVRRLEELRERLTRGEGP